MTLLQIFNDWGNVITITPVSLPFIFAAIYFFLYPLFERFDIM